MASRGVTYLVVDFIVKPKTVLLPRTVTLVTQKTEQIIYENEFIIAFQTHFRHLSVTLTVSRKKGSCFQFIHQPLVFFNILFSGRRAADWSGQKTT